MIDYSQRYRIATGGQIDRTQPLAFRFDGKTYTGFKGDTLASALMANGVTTIARSLKYHRRRGLLAAGVEEPNALVRLGEGPNTRPNLRATEIMLRDGLTAMPQNCWPSLEFDLGSMVELFSPIFGAGFYYKTFMWPPHGWKLYEKLIRKAAGLGRPPVGADLANHEHRYAHCDVLVIGAGPAGLCAASAAGRSGARVFICDERATWGGSLNWLEATIEGQPSASWLNEVVDELSVQDRVTMLSSTTAFACQDHNLVLLEQRLGELDRRLWRLRAKRIVLASGAVERPVVFPGNDRPGILLASAARQYIRQFAVRPGNRAVIVTNNDSAYDAGVDLAAAKIAVIGIVDIRPQPRRVPKVNAAEHPVYTGCRVRGTSGQARLRGIDIVSSDDRPHHLDCDLICMSGGWTPSLNIYSQMQGTLRFQERLGAFVASDCKKPLRVAGAAAGKLTLAECLSDGWDAGKAAASEIGFPINQSRVLDVVCSESVGSDGSTRMASDSLLSARQKSFVDFQSDVTIRDVSIAVKDGFTAIEHVKRYTTTGMGTDQGKTSNVNALALVADLSCRTVSELGHTTFRPPYSPVSLGAIAGESKGRMLAPTRRTPFHDSNENAGAVFMSSGEWLYPRYYRRAGESMAAAIALEVENARSKLGMVDMSTLGKIDVQGRDALVFLERVYCNNLANLIDGKVRYSLMLREDGIVFDDGTVTRIGEAHFIVTTTTARSNAVWLYLEKLRQVHWPDLDVKLALVSEHWACLAVVGPSSRKALASLLPDFDSANEAFPMLSMREGRVSDIPARVFRVSYCGELGYEINVPAGFASRLWALAFKVGRPLGLMPYGLEALDVMRIEKGHISVGSEIDGRSTPGDLGLARMVSKTKDFIGRALLERPALQAKNRRQFVGLTPKDRTTAIPAGGQIVPSRWTGTRQQTQGHVTASVVSHTLQQPIALAMIEGGHSRHGETIWVVSPIAGTSVEVEITSPHFFDPQGSRMRE